MAEILTQKQLDFIEWLVDPQRQGSQNDYGKSIGLSQGALSKWKADGWFRDAWERRLAELNVSPERLQRVVEAMYKQAIGGDVKAANLYLQYVDRFTPKKANIIEDRTVKDMTDDQLADALESNVVHLRRKA